MGCASSKLDDLPAVALCRERCAFLDEAIHHRYALAEAHLAYTHSLQAVGVSLHRFFDQDLDNSSSPVLNLPPQRKGDPELYGAVPAHMAAIHHSHSNSGSHLHFHADSDSDSGSDSPLHHHSGNASPLHSYGQISYADQETLGSYSGGGFMNMNMNINYMKNQGTPSVSYEQRPISSETVYMGESSSSYYPYPYANQNPNSYSYANQNPNSNSYYGGINGFFGSSPSYASSYPPPPAGPVGSANSEASTLKPPPPPPSPPRGSAWDIFNPFESYEKYYPQYTPSRDLKELREEEGIPDLEDEDLEKEVVKEVYREQKFVDSGGGGGKNYANGVAEDQGMKENNSDLLYHMRPSVSMESDPVDDEVHVHMVDKKVVDHEERSGDRGNVAAFKARGDSEVLGEIKLQFERASELGNELAKILEVGKFPYKKNDAYQVSSKMLHVITPSFPVESSNPSTSDKVDLAALEIDEDAGMGSGNLSSTLHKLYLWEKKLYEEVKAEEKMRVLHERKCRKLKRLDERGAEAHKIDATRTLVRSLSTKIRIAIQVVDKISLKINKLRDGELWPQLNSFIQGLTRMWKAMLECHRSQCQAIGQAKLLDAVASSKHFSDAHLDATLQLEHELLNWTLRFSYWIGAQKGCVRALNNWLLKCLLYIPEETPDGIVPFSPGRIGAPPVFVICNQWSQALESISEREVVCSMRDFATTVLHLWERDKMEMRQRMMANKDMERKVKSLEREDQKIQKEIQSLDKMIVLVSGDGNGLSAGGNVVYQSDTSKTCSVQVNLQRIFEAMERLTENSLRAYELLLQRIEEDRQDRLVRESEKVS
ncbi:protein ALTERED PHOSPHATE STARVATION RESPONSE 1-like [Actinidia eriantha]|uniref:protein ALTERED PHOSPHATE STARVATION RESPONSE 1-like n=1 Tax=Actinidia eriantha TaxID=165200 RepID=UPI00258D326E|nr:protein ALTERED PHOSPHATE STARVATION RESPONSE 1-like [Actinidia eriantha]